VIWINEDPLDVATLKARIFTAAQMRDVASKSTLERYVKEGWLKKFFPLAKFDPLPGPPLDWAFPGESRWDKRPPQDVVREAKRRWESLFAKTVPVYVATENAAKLTGGIGTGELRQPLQVAHDLYVTTIFLHQEEKVRRAWKDEDILRSEGWVGLVPDGFAIVDGRPFAFEVVGESYSMERVRDFQK
jgi:hypothetical protein